MHPEHQREEQPRHRAAQILERLEAFREKVDTEEHQREHRVDGDAAEVPYQRGAHVRETPPRICERDDHVEVFHHAEVHEREYRRDHERTQGRKFRKERRAPIEIHAERKENRRNERTRMRDANPEHEQAYRHAPESMHIRSPCGRAFPEGIPQRGQAGQQERKPRI